MMADVLKIGVKGEDGLVKAIAADNDGHIQTGKRWNTKVFTPTKLWGVEIRDTATINECFDVSEYGLISLRIRNGTDQAIKIAFHLDTAENSGSGLRDHNGNKIEIVIPANNVWMLYTPEQIPLLNYVNLLNLWVWATEAPTTGAFSLQVVAKR